MKIFNENFDSSSYSPTDIKKVSAGQSVKLTGNFSINKKNSNNQEFIQVIITKNNSMVGGTVFPDNPMYEFLLPLNGKRLDGNIYGTIYVNGKYTNINLANVEYCEGENVEMSELNQSESNVYRELKDFTEDIMDPFLKAVVKNIYANEKIMRKFLAAPASEFSAYSYLGGLAQMTLKTCEIVQATQDSDLYRAVTKTNSDLMYAAALLCNIGRAYTYDIDDAGNFFKNEYAVIDNDTSLTRDAVKNAIRNVSDSVKPSHPDVVKELIHMLDTAKSALGTNVGSSPRTRHAAVFSALFSIVNATGTFDKLENNNLANDKIVKAYEGGKCMFIPQY
jgi:hypothetical protein